MPSSNVTLWDVIMEHVRELVKFLSTLKKKSSLLLNFETIKTSLDLFLQALNPSPFTVTDALAEQFTYVKIMRDILAPNFLKICSIYSKWFSALIRKFSMFAKEPAWHNRYGNLGITD